MPNTYREKEAMIDIAITAGGLLTSDEIEVQDSRELVQFCMEAGTRFEADFVRDLSSGSADEFDYLKRVEEFALKELKAHYPVGSVLYEPATNTYSG